ncbi:sigma-70 family RNA polymerase sigma factor [Zavarzinia compransoris]|uniref:RNA polymerase subunit sigma n=1 Tax=Zavarzinia compransoris TaxID=1264899 RepID=A0A317E5P6_9PROT|nr:sigma-70 family RNA polymerase sigma factor [Zavarzinia compransoris]PWR21932.1 RNA polymerase subunit sigma [Zavarzinia compransoris]TDP47334.1 RNA polymerase sigma-70 factor (ECF subfamily) [Zavarzinia compransoris]
MDSSDLDREALADLVEAVAQRGDKAAFARLFAYLAPRLKAFLLRLGTTNAAAEELVQEVMLTVWRKAASFDRRQSSATTWTFTIARNRRIDLIRRESKPGLDAGDPALVPAAPVPADVAVDENRRDETLRTAIAGLPPEQADLLKLAFYEGKSHAEIAAVRNLPLGTVKSRLRLAFNRLRSVMEPYL